MTPYTRREFTKLALAALPAAGMLTNLGSVRAAEAAPKPKVDSKVRGVQIGLNMPYSFGTGIMAGKDVLDICLALGVNGLELRTQTVELFLGAPVSSLGRGKDANAAALRAWRAGADVARAKAFRQNFESAGMLIEIVKVDNIFKLGDAELDYLFTLGRAVGARALSAEISADQKDHQRLGKFADKHQMMVGLHGHTHTGPADWEKAIAHSPHIGINLDLGHFVAGNNTSPVEYLKQRHDRITHIHVKDKKMHDGPNTPLGEGDTPIVEVLRLIRDNQWPMQATIEFEYNVPAGSTRFGEIRKCIAYCRNALA